MTDASTQPLKISSPSALSEEAPLDVRTITRGIVRGSEPDFLLFYKEYSPRLFRFLVLLTRGNEDLSRDLHQEVMIKAAQKMKTFESDDKLWAWLSQVARNSWLDHIRKNNRRELRESPENAESTTARHIEKSEHRFLELLEHNLQFLSPEEKELLHSYYFDGHSQKTIAERAGRTAKAVESELARIRRKLKNFLLRQFHEKT